MFAAARIDHLDATIRPALARGAYVVCDRFIDSTRVYQGALEGVDPALLAGLERVAVGDTVPDLTLVLDLDVADGPRPGPRAARRRRGGPLRARGGGLPRGPAPRLPAECRARARALPRGRRRRRRRRRRGHAVADRAGALPGAAHGAGQGNRRGRREGGRGRAGKRPGRGRAAPARDGAAVRPGAGRARAARRLSGRPPAPRLADRRRARHRQGDARLALRPLPPGPPRPGRPAVRAAADLSVPPDHPAARRVASGAPGDVAVLRRAWNDKTGKFFSDIRVDEVRRMSGLFQQASRAGGYRICIIDTAEDLNANSANALLKLDRGAAGALAVPGAGAPAPPRSCRRCARAAASCARPARRRRRRRGAAGAGAALVGDRAGDAGGGRAPRRRLGVGRPALPRRRPAEPRPGRGAPPRPPARGRLGRAPPARRQDRLRRGRFRGADRRHPRLAARAAGRAQGRPGEPRRLAPLAEVWEKVRRSARDTLALNLDKKTFLFSTFADLAQATRAL